MALKAAADVLASSNRAIIQKKGILSSLIMAVINDEINYQSTRTDLDKRTCKTALTLDAEIGDGTKSVQVIQSDLTKVLLSDIKDALTDAGYRISCKLIKSSRTGANDRVKLQVAWG